MGLLFTNFEVLCDIIKSLDSCEEHNLKSHNTDHLVKRIYLIPFIIKMYALK